MLGYNLYKIRIQSCWDIIGVKSGYNRVSCSNRISVIRVYRIRILMKSNEDKIRIKAVQAEHKRRFFYCHFQNLEFAILLFNCLYKSLGLNN